MENFKPTDEDLFDYHIGAADYQLNSKVEAYLNAHPEVRLRLKDFDDLESQFKNFPITEPSDIVLKRVQTMAREELKPGLFASLQSFSLRRSLAWVTMFALVIGLNVILREFRETVPYSHTVNHAKLKTDKNTKDTVQATRTAKAVEVTQTELQLKSEVGDAMVLYTQALGLFHAGDHAKAAELFEKVITTHPDFSKRQDLYRFWIQSLENLGDTAGMKIRQDELNAILSKDSSTF